MNYGDGLNHAFVGFIGLVSQTGPAYNFVCDIFNNLKASQNINTAVWNARVDTGVTNYTVFGNGNATL